MDWFEWRGAVHSVTVEIPVNFEDLELQEFLEVVLVSYSLEVTPLDLNPSTKNQKINRTLTLYEKQ
jgi:hypothetical protein